MKKSACRRRLVALTAVTALFCGGCEEDGVVDFVWGALQREFQHRGRGRVTGIRRGPAPHRGFQDPPRTHW
jgi:hypothetical protein